MVLLRVISGEKTMSLSPTPPGMTTLRRMKSLVVEGSVPYHQWVNATEDAYFLIGDIVGVRQTDGKLAPPSQLKVEQECLENISRIPEIEGRFVLVRVGKNGVCDIWTDQFGRVDIYWQSLGGVTILATSLDHLPVANGGNILDSIGVAHSLTVYGSRPAKQHTLYRDVHRLGVNQGLRMANGTLEILRRAFKLASTVPLYVENDLNRYADYFLEAIRARGSSSGNIVYLSSGWDSTSILASLVHLFGKRKVRAVIGRMQYSDRSGVINQFEIDRARAVANYYGVRLDIIELDYRKNAAAMLERVQGPFRAQQFANLTGVNHWLLAEATAKTTTGDEVIFAGEMSDGAHNLGFSQFVSIFHPASQEFREYSDKMASYLFGPTFLGQLQKGVHEQDPVWQLYKQRNANTIFDQIAVGEREITKQLLASFFLRGGRMPLYSLDNTRLLTAEGRAVYNKESEKVYLDEICDHVTPDNLYATYLHLYNSFHWQGSTVSTLEHTSEAHGLKCVLPFHDSAVIEFLSAMPESWGRGLDLKTTKYPLKWMLRNRIDYPHHLQVGPHAYTYDTDPNFSILGELLHASSLKPSFDKALRKGSFVEKLESNVFDHSYINNKVIKPYLEGKELRGQEMNDLSTIAMHSVIGTFGE
jgi:hypothetical protein